MNWFEFDSRKRKRRTPATLAQTLRGRNREIVAERRPPVSLWHHRCSIIDQAHPPGRAIVALDRAARVLMACARARITSQAIDRTDLCAQRTTIVRSASNWGVPGVGSRDTPGRAGGTEASNQSAECARRLCNVHRGMTLESLRLVPCGARKHGGNLREKRGFAA